MRTLQVTPAYDLRVTIPDTSPVWDRLAQEIPVGGVLQSATLVITSTRSSVSLYYIGRRPDGEMHQRVSVQSVKIESNLGGVDSFLLEAFGHTWGTTLSAFANIPKINRDS